jgi:hypothetical protein
MKKNRQMKQRNHRWIQSGGAATKGARLCEPQHGGNKGRVAFVEALFQAELLRATDPRSNRFAQPAEVFTDSSND